MKSRSGWLLLLMLMVPLTACRDGVGVDEDDLVPAEWALVEFGLEAVPLTSERTGCSVDGQYENDATLIEHVESGSFSLKAGDRYAHTITAWSSCTLVNGNTTGQVDRSGEMEGDYEVSGSTIRIYTDDPAITAALATGTVTATRLELNPFGGRLVFEPR